MKGDFSRLPFRRGAHYTSVRQQQGRVALDSDWNEQASIRERVERACFEEIVGASASPSAEGFAVATDGSTFRLTAGRIYVGGFRCELGSDLQLEHLAGASDTPARGRTDLVYLDVWERHVTAVDDPSILEPALGGADTTTRLDVAWRVRLRENVGRVSPDDLAALLPRQPDGIMSAVAPGGYQGPENQLYRVEIHDSGTAATGTFKWSRNNASTVFAISKFLSPTSVSLPPRTADAPPLSVDDWVEVSGDETEIAGDAGTLARITNLPDDSTVVLDRDVSRQSIETSPRLRRWDHQRGPTLPLTLDWFELEAGIEIRFSEGAYRCGDYWTIPARPATGSIEWPDDRPPDGIDHRFAALALVTWQQSADGWTPKVRDCRRVFRTMTDLYAELSRLRRELDELRGRGSSV
jgi:hypothetical protein